MLPKHKPQSVILFLRPSNFQKTSEIKKNIHDQPKKPRRIPKKTANLSSLQFFDVGFCYLYCCYLPLSSSFAKCIIADLIFANLRVIAIASVLLLFFCCRVFCLLIAFCKVRLSALHFWKASFNFVFLLEHFVFLLSIRHQSFSWNMILKLCKWAIKFGWREVAWSFFGNSWVGQ